MGPCSGCEQQPERDSSVPAWFRADSGTNLILSRGGNVTVRSCGSSAQWRSARTVSERPWVRVPIGQRSVSAPVTCLFCLPLCCARYPGFLFGCVGSWFHYVYFTYLILYTVTIPRKKNSALQTEITSRSAILNQILSSLKGRFLTNLKSFYPLLSIRRHQL